MVSHPTASPGSPSPPETPKTTESSDPAASDNGARQDIDLAKAAAQDDHDPNDDDPLQEDDHQDDLPHDMVEVDSLVKTFGAFAAVNEVSFTVQRGTVLGFLGPNGAGKSTTMKIITGFMRATSGRVSICGYDVSQEPLAAKRHIGYLPEGAPAYSDMTVKSYLSFIAKVRNFRGREAKERVGNIVDKLELGEVIYQPIETLSKGFRCRVGLAQALLHDPAVLILDEPTDGLDPNQKHQVRSLIRTMASDKAIILSTHILEEVEAVCNRALIVARGEIVAAGFPDGDRGWRFGDLHAEAGQLDNLFRQVTTQVPRKARRRRRRRPASAQK